MKIEVLIFGYLAVVFSLLEAYLTLNKIWKRKHERVVADSISILGKFIGIIPVVFLLFYFFSNADVPGFLNRLIVFILLLFHVIIGTGWWVTGERTKGIWKLVKRSLKIERKEVTVLAKSFFRPSGAEKILNILGQTAMIDGVLDKKEAEFIQSFAAEWNIDFSIDQIEIDYHESVGNHYVNLRHSMENYLSISPPKSQVSQLADVLKLLVNVDNNVSEEEQLILDELNGLIANYVNDDLTCCRYFVAIVPQNNKQEEEIPNLLSDQIFTKKQVAGGYAFLSEAFFSQQYAEIVVEQYRAINLFSVVIQPEDKKFFKQ
ncbi:MAG: hypothetical protein HN704_04595 [Bacteroidetes bacterium]|jgi:hypothetical protein|nr:hypothetical protein [Bacteroidota bacterium]MBT6685990.1 hypothetical protein [Bacteroidota bacterium]MBT7143772.1 hypothetical protein [Bacteroidota bacterium]MBT7490871.1 hypothetical protein [Bacteroidota bacterium]